MTQEDKQLLLKDLSARLTYGVIVSTPKGDGHLCSINQTIFGNEYGVNIEATKRDYFDDKECDIKPYLRPMSSMTEEEVTQIEMLGWRRDEYTKEIWGSVDLSQTLSLIEWLNAHHLDYRGLIERGLATEAPEGMYN